MKIHSQNWNLLTGRQIVGLFDEHFPGVTIQPNMTIVMQLKDLESATLECLENRTGSTVYRIRQTGVVYQLCQPDGTCFEFNDIDDYEAADPVDELIESFHQKKIKFTVEEKNGDLWLTHHEPPPFTAKYVGANQGFDNFTWPDGEPDDQIGVMQLAKLMRKAGAFMSSYFKKKL